MDKMGIDKSLLYYLFFPKGYQAICFRAVFYIMPSVLLMWQSNWNISVMLNCVIVYLLIEGLLCPSRNVMNDLKDYQEDQQRGRRWDRYVTKDNWFIVFWANNIKIALTAIVSILWSPSLWIPILGLLVIQLIYDHFLKYRFALLASLVVSWGYGFRVSCVLLGNQAWKWDILALSLIFVTITFAWYQSMEWRYYESYHIKKENVLPKPGSSFFLSQTAYVLVRVVKFLFVLEFLFILQYILVGHHWWKPFIVGLVVMTILDILLPTAWLKNSKRYFNSIFTGAFLGIVISEPFFQALVLSVIVPYFVCYHSKVYIPKETIHIFSNLMN